MSEQFIEMLLMKFGVPTLLLIFLMRLFYVDYSKKQDNLSKMIDDALNTKHKVEKNTTRIDVLEKDVDKLKDK